MEEAPRAVYSLEGAARALPPHYETSKQCVWKHKKGQQNENNNVK